MSEVTNTIEQLGAKVENLINRHKAAVQEANSLRDEVARLQAQLNEKEAELGELSERNKIVKLAKSLAGEGGTENTTELKLKINELLREVDKCIGLLNR